MPSMRYAAALSLYSHVFSRKVFHSFGINALADVGRPFQEQIGPEIQIPAEQGIIASLYEPQVYIPQGDVPYVAVGSGQKNTGLAARPDVLQGNIPDMPAAAGRADDRRLALPPPDAGDDTGFHGDVG